MSRTDVPTGLRSWLARASSRRAPRIALIAVGLGLGTAWAADTVQLAIPEAALTGAVSDDEVSGSHWRAFDPGFIVDHLPFKLTIGQSISYNDNVDNVGFGNPLLVNNNAVSRLPSRGDFYSDTTISGASRFPMGADTFFFNGTYAPRRYFRDTQFNADNYSINGGVDYNLGNRCTGRLIGGVSSNQAPQEETAGLGIFTTETTSFNETARCGISGNVYGLLNSGVSRIENVGDAGIGTTILSASLNNYDQQYVGMGLEYDLTGLDTLKGLVTLTDRTFPNRAGNTGLSSETQQNDFIFTYTRVLSPKLDFSASGGVSTFTTQTVTDLTEPVYTFVLNYRPTPKIAASLTESRSVGAPQSIIADVAENDQQSLSINYRFSAKTSVNAILSRNVSRNPLLGSPTLIGSLPVLYTNYTSNNASLTVNYAATPLVTATASYSFIDRVDPSRSGSDAISNIFRVGLVYTR